MPQTFVIDQQASFQLVFAMACQPKSKFGSNEQETTAQGTPKWELQVAVSSVDQFGRFNSEVLKVGIAAPKNPTEGMALPAPVQLVGFVVGVMDKEIVDRSTGEKVKDGAQVWYRCEAIRPASPMKNAA